VISKGYVEMLCKFCEPELRCRGIDLSLVRFQQDGATAHMARASINFLQETFPQHANSRCNVPRSVRSPYLSSCDTSNGDISTVTF
jgi:hypothetical protein